MFRLRFKPSQTAAYCSSLTCSSQSTTLPSTFLDGDMCHGGGGRGAVPVLLAGREPDHVARADFLDRAAPRWTRPQPAVTISVCPSGCVCHAVRAPGSNVTLAPATRAGGGAQRR